MAPNSAVSVISSQLHALPEVEIQDLSGRVIIVTGANSGLGLEAARHFARMRPACLILAVRDLAKGREAADDIQGSTGCDSIQLWQLDQASFQSVQAFCERALGELPRLDILLLNAGIQREKWVETEDHLESTLQTNAVAPTMLALRLLPLLQQTGMSAGGGFLPHLTITGSGSVARCKHL
jgi:retinol dehydrogenase-12